MVSFRETSGPKEETEAEIMQYIVTNNVKAFEQLDVENINFNFYCTPEAIDLDENITPLISAVYLGRIDMVTLMLKNPRTNPNLHSEETSHSPLTIACLGGHYEIARALVNRGANVEHKPEGSAPPLLLCFSRLDETTNVFENKKICFKLLELLLQNGADINVRQDEESGFTLLIQFSVIEFEPVDLDLHLEMLQFLLEHGADKNLRCYVNNMNAVEYASKSLNSEELLRVINNTQQLYFHPNMKPIDSSKYTLNTEQGRSKKRRAGGKENKGPELIMEDIKIRPGCCSIFGLCNAKIN